MSRAGRVAVFLLGAAAALPAPAGGPRIVPEESIVAVVTRKAGLASGLAHDHLIAATGYEARLTFDPASPAETRFELRARTADLVNDAPELTARWAPRLVELGLIDEPFEAMSDKDRRKVREAMLGPRQLDAERFPEIAGSIVRVEPADDAAFPFAVTLGLEVHGRRVERALRGRFESTDRGTVLEAVGGLRFTELGIKPYSAALGLVRNRDELGIYVRLLAAPRAD